MYDICYVTKLMSVLGYRIAAHLEHSQQSDIANKSTDDGLSSNDASAALLSSPATSTSIPAPHSTYMSKSMYAH